VARFAIDVTACWRPRPMGMLNVAVELSKALVAHMGGDEFTLLCSQERPAAFEDLDTRCCGGGPRLTAVEPINRT
jgi:hypothetical protein